MKNRNISFRLSIYLIVSEILLSVIIIAVGYWFGRNVILENLFHKLQYHTEEVINPIKSSMNETKWLIDNFSTGLDSRNFSSYPEKYTGLVFEVVPDIIAIRIVTVDEKDTTKFKTDHVISRGDKTIEKDKKLFYQEYKDAEDWMNKAYRSGLAIWSPPFYSENNKGDSIKQILIYAKPFFITSGRQLNKAIIYCAISLDNRLKSLHGLNIFQSGMPILMTDKGVVVYPPPKGDVGKGPDVLSQFIDENFEIKRIIKEGKEGSTIVYPDFVNNRKSIAIYWPISSINWLMVAVLPESEYLSGLNKILLLSVLIILFIGSVSTAIVVYLSLKLVSPIELLANYSRKIIEDEGIDASEQIDEVEALTKSMHIMKRKLENSDKERLKSKMDNEEMDKELQLARDIQMGIVPTKFPLFPGRTDFDCYGKLIPAKIVGGDLFDFFLLDDNNLFVSICDTLGKGIPASMFAVVTRTLIRSIANPITRIGKMMELLNDELSLGQASDMFVTVVMGRLNLTSGEFSYCNAGHPRPFILRNDNQIDELGGSHGFPIGVRKNQKFVESVDILSPGESLVAFTDGITEEVDKFGNFFGKERLFAIAQSRNSYSPEKLVEDILSSVDRFRGENEMYDDTTLLAIKYIGKG